MVRVSVQVRNGTARFGVMVQAQSIEQALEIVGKQNPSERYEVTFPIDSAPSSWRTPPPRLGSQRRPKRLLVRASSFTSWGLGGEPPKGRLAGGHEHACPPPERPPRVAETPTGHPSLPSVRLPWERDAAGAYEQD
jgi:hypothetical protein